MSLPPEPAPWVGLNVSNPIRLIAATIQRPTKQLNSGDTTGDLVNGASGFKDLPFDAYFDHAGRWCTTGLPSIMLMELRSKTSIANTMTNQGGAAGVATPGAARWCTAFLQRLAGSDRPYHPPSIPT
ncbi:MAG: hypothetical protein R3C56_12905 [Pirellulaceae bacterium]